MTQAPHDPDHKRTAAVARVLAGESKAAVARDEGIDRGTLREWVYEAVKNKAPPIDSSKPAEHSPAIPSGATVLAIPDMHHPFCHPDALEFLKAVKAKYQATTIVILGDECDFHAFSKYIPDPDGLSPGAELQKAIDSLTPFYLEFPYAFVCESNHTVRPLKRMFDSGLPAAFLPTYSKMLNAPDGWHWKSSWTIDGVRYHHGDAGRSGQFAPAHYMKLFKQSHVHGHLHGYACVMFEGPHFGINAGCLIDTTQYAFKYAKNNPIPVSLGCAVIIEGQHGHFIPMRLDSHSRWIGRL